MMHIKKIIGLSFIIPLVILSSCTKDEEPTLPSLSFKEGPSGNDLFYIAKDTILTVKQPFMLGVVAKSTGEKNLASISIERRLEVVGVTTILKKELSSPSFSVDTLLKANSMTGTEDFICTVTDKNDMSISLHFSIVTEAADPMITRYNNVTLGSYTSIEPNLFSTASGSRIMASKATDSIALQKSSDWVYFHGSETYGHTLASPASNIAAQIYADDIGIWDMGNRNITKFKKTPGVDASQFLAIGDKEQLLNVFDNQEINWEIADKYFSEDNSKPGGFNTGDIIAFKSHTGQLGLIRIISVNPGFINGESTITFDVVIEDL